LAGSKLGREDLLLLPVSTRRRRRRRRKERSEPCLVFGCHAAGWWDGKSERLISRCEWVAKALGF